MLLALASSSINILHYWKVVTVLINDAIWKQHSNTFGHIGLAMCIAAGFLYERAKSEQRAQSEEK